MPEKKCQTSDGRCFQEFKNAVASVYYFVSLSLDVNVKRLMTSQQRQTLQLGAFPQRPGEK